MDNFKLHAYTVWMVKETFMIVLDEFESEKDDKHRAYFAEKVLEALGIIRRMDIFEWLKLKVKYRKVLRECEKFQA